MGTLIAVVIVCSFVLSILLFLRKQLIPPEDQTYHRTDTTPTGKMDLTWEYQQDMKD